MTDDRTLERAARSWLEQGPTQAPDRPVEAALARIQTTRQERDLRIPWRLPEMFTNRVAVAALAIVLIVAGGGFALSRLTGGEVGGPGPTPTATPLPRPTATFAPSPSPAPSPGAITPSDVGRTLRAGTYRVSEFAAPFTVSLPSGWTVQEFTRNNISLRNRNGFLALVVMNAVYPDPCHTETPPTPLEPGVDNLLAALGSMAGFEVSDATDLAMGNASGKAFTISNSIDIEADGCTHPDVVWIGTYELDGTDVPQIFGPGEPETLYAMDAGGTTVLIGGPPELPLVLDSISFEGPSST